jgi:hypothetical protein
LDTIATNKGGIVTAISSWDSSIASILEFPQPVSELRGFVRGMLAAGHDRDDLVRELNRIRLDLASRGQEREEDIVFNVLDALAGLCSPSLEL